MPRKVKDSPRGWYDDFRQKLVKWSGLDKPSEKPAPEYKSALQIKREQGEPALSTADITTEKKEEEK